MASTASLISRGSELEANLRPPFPRKHDRLRVRHPAYRRLNRRLALRPRNRCVAASTGNSSITRTTTRTHRKTLRLLLQVGMTQHLPSRPPWFLRQTSFSSLRVIPTSPSRQWLLP